MKIGPVRHSGFKGWYKFTSAEYQETSIGGYMQEWVSNWTSEMKNSKERQQWRQNDQEHELFSGVWRWFEGHVLRLLLQGGNKVPVYDPS